MREIDDILSENAIRHWAEREIRQIPIFGPTMGNISINSNYGDHSTGCIESDILKYIIKNGYPRLSCYHNNKKIHYLDIYREFEWSILDDDANPAVLEFYCDECSSNVPADWIDDPNVIEAAEKRLQFRNGRR